MINDEDFSKLPLEDQALFLWEHGQFVDLRKDLNHTIQLYAVGKLFYEVWYENEDNQTEKIQKIDADEVVILYP
ncbi:MAG: hypothetical protein NVV82_08620 [Sporocytophaga sp.]|jgi:hypothetical protein|nr:hypothetical protein [Sporocytophaga sp.]